MAATDYPPEAADIGLTRLAQLLRRGGLSLAEYLDVLEERFEQREPEILAFVAEDGRFDRLRREARALEAQYPEPAGRPPLYGVAVGIKDIFHVEGLPTQAGSRLPATELEGPEGEAVARLKAAGALILGKTATTEFAYFAPAATHNPRAPGHTPGGSSSGSAAAVAARICALTLGTQTIGSISRPAAYCGVVGFKPTYGRIATAGVIPLSPSLDHVGFFTADCADIELAASVLLRDWQPIDVPASLRLGVPVGPYLESASAAGRERFAVDRKRLDEAGFEIVEAPVMADFEAIVDRHNLILAAEAAQVHGRWFASYRGLYHPRTVELIERGLTIDRSDLGRALEQRGELTAELEDTMRERGIDLWISPAAPGPAPAGLDFTGDPIMNLPWSHAGMPTLALPSGSVDVAEPSGSVNSLPIGLQVAAPRGADALLPAAGRRIERALR